MKKTLIIIVALTLTALTACTNKSAKAQALLIEAISYADGGTPGCQEKALKKAEKKGILFINKPGGRSREEIVIIVANDLCAEILAKYPETPAAIRAAELQRQIQQRLQIMIQIRIQSMYRDPYQ
jgi:membrane-bound ClpP family serine protease